MDKEPRQRQGVFQVSQDARDEYHVVAATTSPPDTKTSNSASRGVPPPPARVVNTEHSCFAEVSGIQFRPPVSADPQINPDPIESQKDVSETAMTAQLAARCPHGTSSAQVRTTSRQWWAALCDPG